MKRYVKAHYTVQDLPNFKVDSVELQDDRSVIVDLYSDDTQYAGDMQLHIPEAAFNEIVKIDVNGNDADVEIWDGTRRRAYKVYDIDPGFEWDQAAWTGMSYLLDHNGVSEDQFDKWLVK